MVNLEDKNMEIASITINWDLLNTTNLLLVIFLMLLLYYVWPVWDHPLKHLPGPTPLPLLGNLLPYLLHGIPKTDLALIKKYGKTFRIHIGRDDALVVADVDILRKILVKDFVHFINRRQVYFRGLLQDSLLLVSDSDWRRQRHELSPNFASGKLKKMMPQIVRCVKQLCSNLDTKADSVDTKSLSGCFTMDIIASTSFGIDLDSQKNPKHPFVLHAKKMVSVSNLNPVNLIMTFAPFLIPLLNAFGAQIFSNETSRFFYTLMEKLLKDRKGSETDERHDFLQLLIKSHKSDKLSFKEVVAQGVLFFLAAYDTTSTTLSFLMYELSRNSDIQEKLYLEIQEGTNNWNDCQYDTVIKLSYLDQCIQEILRLYPPATRTTRRAGQDITINGLYIPKGTSVIIPIYALQHDPQVWESPSKFDPSRFDPNQRQNRDQMNYIPFGNGPRQCIGMRLAHLEIKMALVYMMKDYLLEPSDKKLELKEQLLLQPKSGVWVKPVKRFSKAD